MYLQVFISLFLPRFIFFLTINVPASQGHNWEKYFDCFHPFECGKIKANYPFWGHHRPHICGHPELELKCKDQSIPLIFINGIRYNISEINETSQTLRISRVDYQEGFCKPQFGNTTLLPSLLKLSSNIEMITFFYDCSSSPELMRMRGLNCSGGNDFVCKAGTDDAPRDCQNNVTLPIKKKFTLHEMKDLSVLKQELREGFVVKWNASGTDKECQECMKSNGTCTYDPEKNQMVCYCLNESGTLTTCPGSQGALASSGKRNWTTIVNGLGIAVGSVAVVFLGATFFLIIRQRRRRIEIRFISNKDLEAPPSSKNITTSTSTRFSKSIPSYDFPISDVEKTSTYFGAQIFNYIELKKATNNFDASKEIGNGGFGTVYHGVLKDGREVAVKRLYEHNFKHKQLFLTEIEILTRLKHPNLVILYGCTSRNSKELLLVYEYIPNGTLGDHLQGRKPNFGLLTWSIRLGIAVETANALAYLHSSDVIHRDIKSRNILLDNKFHAKVADFGLSRLFPNGATHVSTAPQGTPGYVDPDYYQCYKLSDKSDVFSFGVVLIELISSLPAVDTNRAKHDINLSNMAINRIQNQMLDELVDPSLGFETDYEVKNTIMLVAELAFRCLQQDTEIRPLMQEVLDVLREIQNNKKNGKLKAEEDDDIFDTGHRVVLLKECPQSLFTT